MQYSKLSIIILFLITSVNLCANMASPDRYGLHPSLGIQSCDVDIDSENLSITLADSALYANYNVQYHITNEKEQDWFTLIFDCTLAFTDFEVYLDGTHIDIKKSDVDSLLIDSLDKNFTPFTLLLDKGKHTINVRYKGYPDSNVGSLITKYKFKYNLDPVRGWRSFNNLNLLIDASAIKEDISIKIGDSIYQIGGKIQQWQFDDIPQKMLEIKFEPKEDLTYNLEPSDFFYATFLIFFIINITWSILWRRKYVWEKVPIPAIMGAVVIPALALFSYIFGVGLIDDLIGQYASRRHGYIFLIVFTYPFWAIIYFIVVWAIDYNYKHKLRSENYNIKGFAKQILKTLAIILVIILVSSVLLFYFFSLVL